MKALLCVSSALAWLFSAFSGDFTPAQPVDDVRVQQALLSCPQTNDAAVRARVAAGLVHAWVSQGTVPGKVLLEETFENGWGSFTRRNGVSRLCADGRGGHSVELEVSETNSHASVSTEWGQGVKVDPTHMLAVLWEAQSEPGGVAPLFVIDYRNSKGEMLDKPNHMSSVDFARPAEFRRNAWSLGDQIPPGTAYAHLQFCTSQSITNCMCGFDNVRVVDLTDAVDEALAGELAVRAEREAAASDAVLVYSDDNLCATYPVLPCSDAMPCAAGAPLRLRESPGEKTRATAILWSKTAYDGVTVAFSDLTRGLSGSVDRIPSSNLYAKVVKVHYQAAGAPNGTLIPVEDQTLVPELLLNDDSLVVPDHDAHRNLVKHQWGGNTWYADINTIAAKNFFTAPSAEELPIVDAKTLQPFDLPAEQNKQLMIRLTVPSGTMAGTYTGRISFASHGREIAVLPIELEVLPFRLPELAETVYDQNRVYEMGLYAWPYVGTDGLATLSPMRRSREQVLGEFRTLVDNGITSPAFCWDAGLITNEKRFREHLAILREAGFPGKTLHLGATGMLCNPNAYGEPLTDPADLLAMQGRLVTALAIAREYGFDEVYFYGVDEAKGGAVTAQIPAWKAAHEVGAKVMVSGYYGHFNLVGDILDLIVYAEDAAKEDTARWHRNGGRLWKYNTPQACVEDPGIYRRNYGLDIWKRGFDGANTYCDFSSPALWNDLAGLQARVSSTNKAYRLIGMLYPTIDGVVETMALTGFESAIKDVRIMTKFLQALRRSPNPEAQAWFDALCPESDDPVKMRREAIDWILLLSKGCTAGDFAPDGRGRLNWSNWIDERPSWYGSSGVWSGENVSIGRDYVGFQDDDELPDAKFAPTECEPTNAVTEATAFVCFKCPFGDDVDAGDMQAALRMICVTNAGGEAEACLSCVINGCWTNVSVSGVTLDFDATYGVRTRLDRTVVPHRVSYSLQVGQEWRELCSGPVRAASPSFEYVGFRGAGALVSLSADSNIPVPDGITAHAGTKLYATVDEAVASGGGKVTALADTTYVPAGGETVDVAAGTLTLTRPAPACEPELVAEGRTLHFDATQGIESFTNAAGEVCVTRWHSLAGNGWTAEPGPSYHGWVRYPRLLQDDCNGNPAVRLANGTLDTGDEYMLLQKDGVTTRSGDICSVFWVIGSQDGGGYLLGGGGPNGYAFHRGGDESVCTVHTNPLLAGAAHSAVLAGNWRVNGATVKPRQTGLSGYYDLVSMSLTSTGYATLPNCDGFTFDGRFLGSKQRYADAHGRIGHQRLSELIVYDRILSDAERDRVEAYLSRKWTMTDDTWRHPAAFDVASGATLDVTADAVRRLATLSGSGTVRGDVTVDRLVARVGAEPVDVTGRLVFASNFVLRVEGLEDDGRNSYAIPIASASSVSGIPSESDLNCEGVPTDMKARLSFGGGQLRLLLWRKEGTVFTIGEYFKHVDYRAQAVSEAAVQAARATHPRAYSAAPVPERPERAAAAEGAVLVYAADNLTSSYPILPNSTNVPGPAGASLCWRECPGERTRATAVLWSKTPHEDVTVEFSDLTGAVGTIPAGCLSAKVVKPWYQANGAPDRHTSYSYEQVLVSELMLNDDDLVIPDHDNRRNLVRFRQGSRTWYADLSTFQSEGWAELIPAEQMPIYDAPVLQPFDLAARESKQLMIRLCVPAEANAGDYAGTVRFRSGDTAIAELPVKLTVLPFSLPVHPETVYDPTREYTMGLYLWNSFNKTDTDYVAVYHRSRRQLQNEYASLLDNGITSPTFIWYKSDVYDDAKFRRNLEEVRKAGFSGRRLHLGSSDLIGSDSSPQALLTLTNNIVRALATAREYGYDDIYFYGQDEIVDPTVLTNEVHVWRAVHAVGGKVMVSTIEANRPHFQNELDLAVHSHSYDDIGAVDVKAWHDGGTLLWKYGSPQTYYENPLLYRRNFGLGIWLRGFDGANTYCDVGGSWAWYDAASIRLRAETDGEMGGVGRALTLFYPVPDGVIETLALTGLESAIKDVRYFSLLRQRLRQHPDAEIQAWIDALDIDAVDLAELRQQVIDRILLLL